jgi:dTMP kinase
MQHGIQRLTAGEARLVTAVARDRNTRVLLDVIDESLRRAEELRRERQAEEAERREIEARQERRRQVEETERRDAERVARESELREAQVLERAAVRESDEQTAVLARQQQSEARDALALIDVVA